jgi:hypothetical protein
MAELLSQIINDLKKDDLFHDYKFRKRDTTFSLNTEFKRLSIELDHWRDVSRDALIVYPIYSVRFDILHRWWEQFGFKTLQDQRDTYSVGLCGAMISEQNEVSFLYNLSDYDCAYQHLKYTLSKCSGLVFDAYSTLEKFFASKVLPILENKQTLPDMSADWIFIYSGLCFLVAPERYKEFKAKMLNHIEWMYSRHEPNVAEYYGQYDEIFSYMEANLKLPNGYPSLG